MISALILAALSVVPVYTNHNRVAGNVQVMTNLQAWASAVESAIGSGGGGGLDTNAVKSLISSSSVTNGGAMAYTDASSAQTLASAISASRQMTNAVPRIVSGGNEIRADGTVTKIEILNEWSPSQTATNIVDEILTYYNNVQWVDSGTRSFWGVVKWTFQHGNWYDWPVIMSGPQATDPNATELTFPDGTKTYRRRAVTTRIATTNDVAAVSNRVDYLDGYMAGQRVRVSVTNYYGNTSGELPRLRFEEYVTETNTIGGVEVETNYWKTVWDEQSKYDRFLTLATAAIAAMTQDLYRVYYNLLQERLATKAPRAWGTLTSAGEAAPQGKVWLTEPNTVFAGGTEYAHAMVGTGVIGVLTSKGAAVYTDGEVGRFHFTTDDRRYHFGMNISSRYEIGCATDGITVTPVAGNQMVDLTYNITMSGKPILYYTPSLTPPVSWEQITDSSGSPISGATVYASWDQSPPAGAEICTINCGASLSGFFKASVEYAGTSKFETNMMADLAGGIIATNQTTNQMQPVEPYISSGSVLWRVKQ